MNPWSNEKKRGRFTSRQITVGILFLLAAYFLLFQRLLKKADLSLQEAIRNSEKQIKRYTLADKTLPSAESQKRLEQYLKKCLQNYQTLGDFIDPMILRLPASAQEPGLFYLERLHTVEKKLQRQAALKKINLPKTLGFSEEIPRLEEVEILLRQIEMVDVLSAKLMEGNLSEIYLIKPLKSIERVDSETEKPFYCEIPVQIGFISDTESLIRFLYEIKNLSPVIYVEDLEVKSLEEPKIKTELVLSSFWIKDARIN
jgi:hypothetical protein